MKSFGIFILEERDSFEYHLNKLHKTEKSIQNHVKRGGHANTQKGYELIDRYDNHLKQIKQKHYDDWKSHCKTKNIDPLHSGIDLYA
jgi:hypothetical protein